MKKAYNSEKKQMEYVKMTASYGNYILFKVATDT